MMPPRKAPKEQVHYPPSKRKAPPFKPLRPSKLARVTSTESERSTTVEPHDRSALATERAEPTRSIAISDSEDDEDEEARFDSLTREDSVKDGSSSGESSEDLAEDPLDGKARKKRPPTNAFRPVSKMIKRRAPSTRESPPKRLDHDHQSPPPPLPSQSASTPSIPQPLLVRLLHESFRKQSTKIDRHAVEVVQRYVEIFVREAIARAAQLKKEAAGKGDVDQADTGWLELEDLEKAAPGMLLDF